MFCPECGFKNPDNADECLNCGTQIGSSEKSALRLKESPSEPPPANEMEEPEKEEEEEIYTLPPEEASMAKEEAGEKEEDLLNGRYKVIDILHRTDKSVIYRAKDSENNKTVVIKEMIDDFKTESESAAAADKFKRKVDVLEQLDYIGLPRVIDSFNDGKKYYVVKTFVEGKSIREIMKQGNNKPLNKDRVLKWSLGMLKVLNYLHTQNPPIYFKNIRPSNIMVDNSDEVYLVDFDLDRILSAKETARLQGLPGFMAPEQFKNIADAHSDIFSLGMLIRYLMTGIDPSDQKNRYRRYKRIKDVNSKVDKWFDDIVLKMIEKSPDYRPSSAKELIDLFESKMSGKPVQSTAKSVIKRPKGLSKPGPKVPPPPMKPQQVLPTQPPKTSGVRNYFIIFILLAVIGIPILLLAGVLFGPKLYSEHQVKTAKESLEKKQYSEAVTALKSANSVYGKNPEVHFLLGKAYMGKKEYNKAIESYEKAINLDRTFKADAGEDISKAYLEKGKEALKKRDYPKAVNDFKDAFNHNPQLSKSEEPESLFYQGILAQYGGRRYKIAVDLYTKSLNKKPDADVYISRALCYVAMGNYKEAKSDFDNALKSDPDKKEEVQEGIKQALKQATSNLAKKIRSKVYDDAIREIEQLQAIFKKVDPNLIKLKGACYMEKGKQAYLRRNYEEAEKSLTEAISLFPENPESYFYRGETYYSLGKWDEAIKDYQKAMKLDLKNYRRRVTGKISAAQRAKQRGLKPPTRITYRPGKTPTPAVTKAPVKKGSQQYYILGGSTYRGYIAKKHKGGTYLIKSRRYLKSKNWYSANPSGFNKIKLIETRYGRTREYECSVKKLNKFFVSYVTNSKRTVKTRRTSRRSKKVYTSTVVKTVNRVTLRTESNTVIFLEGTYATRYLKRGKTYYGTLTASNVELFMGKTYTARKFPIKGRGGIH